MKLPLSIALTQLKERKKQTFVVTIGVSLGVAIFIFLSCYVRGVNEYLTELSLEQLPDIHLFDDNTHPLKQERKQNISIVGHETKSKKHQGIMNAKVLISRIKSLPEVDKVSGSTKISVIFNIKGQKKQGVAFGINPFDEVPMYNLKSKTLHGDIYSIAELPNGLALGEKLAEMLGVSYKDKILMSNIDGKELTMKVVAIIKTGIPDLDKNICYIGTNSVIKLSDKPLGFISDINIKLLDRSNSHAVLEKLTRNFGCYGVTYVEENPILFEGRQLQNIVFFCISIGILLVAGFGIFNTLNMMIYEKMKDISIMKAVGFSDNDIKLIFIYQSSIIGFSGSLIGVFLGWLFSYVMSSLPYKSDFLSIESLPMYFNLMYYFIAFLFGMLSTFLAGYLPARKASKLDPITIFRG